MIKVHLYQRSGCSLCEAVAMELEEMRKEVPFEIIYRDVDSNEQWQEKYNLLVPVVTDSDDNKLCHYFLDQQKVQNYLSNT